MTAQFLKLGVWVNDCLSGCGLLMLLSHIHNLYQDLYMTKLDLKVVLGRGTSLKICKYVLSIQLSYDRHTVQYDGVCSLCESNTTCIRPVTTVIQLSMMSTRWPWDHTRLQSRKCRVWSYTNRVQSYEFFSTLPCMTEHDRHTTGQDWTRIYMMFIRSSIVIQ